ncbi:MAG: glycosyltransferase [Chitinophagaceae bacterium]
MAELLSKINTTILIAPLDWGLGHATRCIPIIRVLLQKNCRVVVAASGFHESLLRQEFPDLEFIHLDGYGINYSTKYVLLGLILQLPRFFRNIKNEHNWLKNTVDQYKLDGIISDNRYGLYTDKVPCVFITHQLQPKAPKLFKMIEASSRKQLYSFVNRFSECWVPDETGSEKSLAGSLSHPAKLPVVPIKYIGWLTRFSPARFVQKKYLLTISLSGPEPQRSLLEGIILPQLQNINGQVLLVRGMPGATSMPEVQEHITVANHLPAKKMENAFLESEFVLSRCGYSTLMDMQSLHCQCIFIPTPGQTEQEYLGEMLAAKKIAIVKPQDNFDLANALEDAATFPFAEGIAYKNSLLEPVLSGWLQSLNKR